MPLQNISKKNLLEILFWQYLARSTKNSFFFYLCPNNTDRMETIQGNSLCSDKPPGEKGARNCLQRAFTRVSIGGEAMLPPHFGGVGIHGNHSLNSRWRLENCAEMWAGKNLFCERCCRNSMQKEPFIQQLHL